MNVYDFSQSVKKILTPHYGATEATAMMRLIFFALKGWSATDIICNGDLPVSDFLIKRVDDILSRLAKDEPIQYVLGFARFYGMDLEVNPSVLIPRHETEELVDIIVDTYRDKSDLKVLDIGCGSGAIAIALARNLPFSDVTAMDVSADAVEVARRNSERLHARIKLLKADIFSWTPSGCNYDIIVSNPPYVCEKEKKDMERNVLDYEPYGALFVADSEPLKYYTRIADVAAGALVEGGGLYFEINPLFASELKSMLVAKGFGEVNVLKDISGKDRFASCIKIKGEGE